MPAETPVASLFSPRQRFSSSAPHAIAELHFLKRGREESPAGRGPRSGSVRHWLLARATVDALTQQIGVADVAGILLHKVNDDAAPLDLLPVDLDQRVQV